MTNRPQIITKAGEYPQRVSAAISAAITSIALAGIPVAQAFEWIAWDAEQTSIVSFFVGAVAAAVGGLLSAVRYGERRTTPLINPKTDDGTRLVELPPLPPQI